VLKQGFESSGRQFERLGMGERPKIMDKLNKARRVGDLFPIGTASGRGELRACKEWSFEVLSLYLAS